MSAPELRMIGAEGPSCVGGVCSVPGDPAIVEPLSETAAGAAGDGRDQAGAASSTIPTPWQN